MGKHNILGKDGEEAAVNYLIENGYNVLHRNWRSGHYELDIVAEKGDVLVSIEVKTRHSDTFYRPDEAVNRSKIRRLVRATDVYVKLFHIHKQVRFDVIAIVGDADDFKIEHIEEAFFPPMF
jgi:putative endonuclease